MLEPVKETNLYQMAKTFAGSVRSNEVKVAPPSKDNTKPKNDF